MRSLLPALLASTLATAAAAQAPAPPRIERHRLTSRVLGGDRELLVRTPPEYERSGAPYAVLYLTDAETQLPLLVETIRFLARHGRIPELIVVGLTHVDRTRELTPTRAGPPDAPPGAEGTGGGADAFLAYVEREVIPFVERRYRTLPYRILAGHSLGGLFALHTLTARPELFQARIAVSPTLLWDGELPLRRTKALLERRPDLSTTIVFTVGDEGVELADAFRRFGEAVAKAPRVRARGLHLPGEDHGTVVFDSHYRALREVFDGWRMPVDEGAVGPKGGAAAVEAYYRGLSERLGMKLQAPEQPLNLAGYQLLREDQVDAAIATFRRGLELYPSSPNAHDSLGEALERKGDLDGALARYREATALGEKHRDPLASAFRANRDRLEQARKKGARR